MGGLQERMHTRELGRMGGLWSVAPRLSGAALFFSLASLGLPGMGDFVGEFLVLLGSYKISVPIAVVASLGILASTFYALRMVQSAFQGPNTNAWQLLRSDAARRTDGGGDDRGPVVAGALSAAGVQYLCAGSR